MAKLTRKILGNINGSVADITFANWKGKTVIKSKLEGSDKAPTNAQLLVRDRFKKMTDLSNAFSSVISDSLKSQEVTAFNQFRKLNTSILSGAVGAIVPDYSKLLLSQGKLEALDNVTTSVNAQTITVNWNFQNMGDANDEIIAVAYNPTLNRIVKNTTSVRSSGTTSFTVPTQWTGQEVYVYVFSGNKDAKSTTQYLGSVTIQ